MPLYDLNLIHNGEIKQTQRCEFPNADEAYKEAHSKPLLQDIKRALWVEIKPVPAEAKK